MTFQPIRKLLNRLLVDKNFTKLCFEIFMFTMLFGIAFHSLLLFSLMFAGMFWLIHRYKGIIYTVIALSCVWGVIAAS